MFDVPYAFPATGTDYPCNCIDQLAVNPSVSYGLSSAIPLNRYTIGSFSASSVFRAYFCY